jgi:glycosyltransferase involved in cell wall biosynthesis
MASSTSHPPRLLFVIGSLAVGGTERHVADIAPALAQRGYDVTVYCLSEPGALAAALAAQGVGVIAPPFGGGADGAGRLGRRLRFAAGAAYLYTLLATRRPALVHCFLPVANVVGLVLARAAFLPRIVTSRRSLNRFQQRQPLLGKLERSINPRADAVVTNSHAAAAELVAEGVDARLISVIHNGIPTGRVATPLSRAEAREQLGLPADALVIVVVANLIGYKRHVDLVAALGRAAPGLPPFVLLVAGRDDGEGEAVRRAAATYGIGARVRLLGERSDLAALLRAADIGVLCSSEEGFPTAVVEYMAAGLAVVATDVGGTAEAVLDGETGFLVPASDVDALAERLTALGADPELRLRQGQAGRARAGELFTLEACVAAYDRLYRRLLPPA